MHVRKLGDGGGIENVKQMYHTTSGGLGHETNNSLDGSCIAASKRKSENGDTSGEQREIALCLHSDSVGASEEEDHETSEQEDNYSGVESASSAEQEAALADSEEQARPQSPLNAEENNVMEDEVEDDHLSNNSREEGSAPHDTQDLPLPAEVLIQVTNNSLCEGNSHTVSPPEGDSPTALDHQEGVQVGKRAKVTSNRFSKEEKTNTATTVTGKKEDAKTM